MEQGFGEFDTPLQATGERFDELSAALMESYALQYVLGALAQQASMQAIEMAMMTYILLHGELAVETGMLENHPELCADGGCLTPQVISQELYLAVCHGDKSRKQMEQGSFATAVRAQEANNFPTLNLECNVIERDTGAIAMGQALEAHGWTLRCEGG